MDTSYPPRVVSITPAGLNCDLHLNTGCVITIGLSIESLNSYLNQQEFPAVDELIRRGLIVAYPAPLRMTADEWATISTILKTCERFQAITARSPKLLEDIQKQFAQLQTMPHQLYGGVGMHIDGKGTATLYTSHPLDFQVDQNKGKSWYFKLLESGDDEYVLTHVNVDTHDVETQTGRLSCHYVTNSNVSEPRGLP